MQYKVSLNNYLWSPKDSPSILFWQANAKGPPKLLMGMPSPIFFCLIWGNDASRFMEKENFIIIKTYKFVEFSRQDIVKDDTYACVMNPNVDYWKMLLHLSKSLPPQSLILLEGFWPSNNWRSNHVRGFLPNTFDVIDAKDPIIPPYYGPKNMKPFVRIVVHTPLRTLMQETLFKIVRSHNPKLILCGWEEQRVMS